jgi:hypothetical protein
MNSITIILVRDWCVPHHMILQGKTILGPTYAYPTYFNIKILVRDWCVPHQVICLEEKVFMCHTCTGICIIYCVCIYILLHILTSKYWLETGVSLTKWFLLRKKVFMWHICIFNIRIIRENNFRSKICISYIF